MDIHELHATISIGRTSQIELAKGKDLPSGTVRMFGVVGLILEKERPYIMIRIIKSPDKVLFKIENMLFADSLLREVKANQHLK